jgi:macrolide-specific efflux system membrane fusion protein
VTVAVADIEDTVLATGKIEASQMVSVGAQVSGQIKHLAVGLGDTVRKGQLVVEIDSLTQQNALRTAEASLANVVAQRRAKQAAFDQARLALARQRRMLADDATATADVEAAEAAAASAGAEIAALEAQIRQAGVAVDSARVNLAYTRITAPIDGTVVGVVVKEGQTVNANQTTPTLIKIAQLDRMTVKAELSEADVVRVQPGQPVRFTILGEPDRPYQATLRAIKPTPDSIADQDSGTSTSTTTGGSSSSGSSSSTSSAIYYDGLFDVPNPDGKLKIAMTAKVTIVLKRATAALILPSTVLGDANADGTYTVTVLDADGHPAPRRIRVGIDNSVSAEVLEGLAAGARVVAVDLTRPASSAQQMRPPPPMGF